MTHGLPADGGAADSWFRIRIGWLVIPLPNPPARRRAVFVHDVNHVLTGYNTTFSDGEMSIAAFEVGSGCGRVWAAWFLNLMLMALAALTRPTLAVRAFARGRAADSLYRLGRTPEQLRPMLVGDVRRLIRLDAVAVTVRPSTVVLFVAAAAVVWAAALGTLAAIVVGCTRLVRSGWFT